MTNHVPALKKQIANLQGEVRRLRDLEIDHDFMMAGLRALATPFFGEKEHSIHEDLNLLSRLVSMGADNRPVPLLHQLQTVLQEIHDFKCDERHLRSFNAKQGLPKAMALKQCENLERRQELEELIRCLPLESPDGPAYIRDVRLRDNGSEK